MIQTPTYSQLAYTTLPTAKMAYFLSQNVLVIGSSMSQSSPITSFSRESQLSASLLSTLGPFWQSRKEGYINGAENKKIYWVNLTKAEHTKAIVVVNGRVESVWKYQELFFDLYQQGYDIYSFDHRGQGLSERMHSDHQMGHIDKFDNYVTDMSQVLQHFNLDGYDKKFLLAHSMGGAISVRYLQTTPQHGFDAAVLSAPMMGIHLAWYLRPIAAKLMHCLAKISKLPNYAPGQKPYYGKPFEGNTLTQSRQRYRWYRELYSEKPELRIGGASSQWVSEGFKAAKSCVEQADKIHIPVLLLQASDDSVVDNLAQQTFIKNLNRQHILGELIPISGSRHEVLFEKDDIRNQSLSVVMEFLQRQQ